jgi:hypothetical protein
MTAFSAIAAVQPPSFVVVPVDAWRSDWEDRPKEELAAGLRLISHQDLQAARAQGSERAKQAFPDIDIENPLDLQAWADAYNDAILGHIVAMALCDPNDVSEPWEPIKAAPEDMVREFMTSDGLRLIYDAWERTRISVDPTQREATDEEIDTLPALMREKGTTLTRTTSSRARRLLAFILDEIAGNS